MPTLVDRNVHDLASARIGRTLIRYRFLIFMALLLFAAALASADRHLAAGTTNHASMLPAPPPAAENSPADDRPLVLPDR